MSLQNLRADFPTLSRSFGQYPLAYLDNAATSLKPRIVIETLSRFYSECGSNIHRGSHRLGFEATELFENARETFAQYLGTDSKNVAFTKNATEALNIVAAGLCSNQTLKAGDTILCSLLEHHANFVPWQQWAARIGAKVEVINVTSDGILDWQDFTAKLARQPKVVAITQTSNILGTKVDIGRAATLAKSAGALVVVDGCQGAPHSSINLKELGVDFYALSAHKMLGPTGVGILASGTQALSHLPPLLFGGSMIREVRIEKSTFQDAPGRFEGGTPPVADAIGAAAGLTYLQNIDQKQRELHAQSLLAQAIHGLSRIPGVRCYGSSDVQTRSAVLSFSVEKVHAHDVAQVLDSVGVAVRSGDHCAQPLLRHLGIGSTVRASFLFYNTSEEVDRLVAGVQEAVSILT